MLAIPAFQRHGQRSVQFKFYGNERDRTARRKWINYDLGPLDSHGRPGDDGGKPACARCQSERVWTIRKGTTFECAECGHQTSLTSGTVLEKTRKPLKVWFRAVFEVSTRRTGISAMDLMRIMGFGSYKTAWTWLHKLRAALVRPEREPLGPFVQMDEALIGGKGGPHKELVLVAAEADGRVRLAHAETNDKATLKRFADGQVAADARVVTDGLASYDGDSLGERPCERVVQTKAERRESDALQVCHWTISLLKRWLFCWARTRARWRLSTCRPTSTSTPSVTTAARPRAWAGSRPVSSSGSWCASR